jgi:hypothetical protein
MGAGSATDYKAEAQHENKLMPLLDKVLLRKRALIECE